MKSKSSAMWVSQDLRAELQIHRASTRPPSSRSQTRILQEAVKHEKLSRCGSKDVRVIKTHGSYDGGVAARLGSQHSDMLTCEGELTIDAGQNKSAHG